MGAKKEYEYREGTQARQHFEAGMKALFQVPKEEVPIEKARKKRAKRKSKASRRGVSRDSGEASGAS